MTYCVRDGIVVWQKCSVEKTYFNKEGQIHCDDDLPAIYSSACGGVQRWYYNGIGYKSYYQNFLGQPLYVNAYPVTRHITEEEFNNLHHS
jgi:hypothetical protein